jgi:hypothetical protein
MKRLLAALAIAASSASALATNVSVSITVGEPGYFGRIDVINYPPPQLLFPEPIIVEPVPVGVARPPVYVYVPVAEAKHWRKHCKKYKACGQPVYFVQDTWYNDVYVPEHRKFKAGKHKGKAGKSKKPKKE